MDASGNGRDATQGTGAAKPTYRTNVVNGKPVVRFDGVDDELELPDFLTSFTAGEIFYVLKAVADPPLVGNQGFTLFGANTGNLYPFSDSVIYDSFGSTVRHTTVDPTPSLVVFHVYNTTSQANEWTSRINGTQIFTTGTNTVGWTPFPRIGQGGSNIFGNHDYAEIVLYNRVLSTSERQQVEDYLMTKYGL
jgi:hypothetical protein